MKERIALSKNVVICQKWEESERGWGTRPNGFSLHCSEADRRRYVEQYWQGMPDSAPDEYSRPCGDAYPVGVSDEVLAEITASEKGKRYYFDNYPGSGGIDGWMPA